MRQTSIKVENVMHPRIQSGKFSVIEITVVVYLLDVYFCIINYLVHMRVDLKRTVVGD